MKTAIISDVHSNLEALEAVLEDIEKQGIKDIFCLGDAIGYGANPFECMRRLEELNVHCLMGNHEFALKNSEYRKELNSWAKEAIEWMEKLNEENMLESPFFENLPYVMALPLESKEAHNVKSQKFLASHSTITDPEEFNYVYTQDDATEELLKISEDGSNLLFIGHTHQPLVWCFNKAEDTVTMMLPRFPKRSCKIGLDLKNKVYVVNAGSVGQPRDSDPRACYVVYNDDRKEIIFKRVKYNIENAHKKIIAAGLPESLAARLYEGR